MIFAHIKRGENLGDEVCCPKDYFIEFKYRLVYDFRDIQDVKGEQIIIGGGGMMHSVHCYEWMLKLAESNRIILWGIGKNWEYSTFKESELREKHYELISHPNIELSGIRDYPANNMEGEYVPCVSCLRPEFQNAKYNTPLYDVVVFEHYEHPIEISDFSKMNNKFENGICQSKITETIRFLSLGKTIITNSYHGAYWGYLLGKNVLIYEPFSNRFDFLKPTKIVCNRNNYKEKLEESNYTLWYLEECQRLNLNFYKKIAKMIV